MRGKELRQALTAGQRVYGIAAEGYGQPRWPRLFARLGLDFVFLDNEHTPLNRETVAWAAQAYAANGVAPLLRIPEASPCQAAMGLDLGAHGIIAPYVEAVEPLKHHPLTRALRADKLCLAGLQATLLAYLTDKAVEQVPVWRMIAAPLEEIAQRARRWRRALRRAGVEAEIVDSASTVGGGSLPGETLPTKLVALPVAHPDQLAAALRAADPPVIARIEADRLVLDPRTVLVEEERELLRVVKELAI